MGQWVNESMGRRVDGLMGRWVWVDDGTIMGRWDDYGTMGQLVMLVVNCWWVDGLMG
jgi:hypothetical protein